VTNPDDNWLDQASWNEAGLVPVITQEYATGDILMLAWMNRDALRASIETGVAVYWSRSRQCLWRKGEKSSHEQRLHDIRLDCDNDALLLRVEQIGGIACHTGRKSCFYQQLQQGHWRAVEPVLKSENEIYG